MQVMDALGDPVRRRLLELLADGERTAGELADAIGDELGVSQPGTSRHLRVLRDAGVVQSVVDGQRRLYSVRAERLDEVEQWVRGIRRFWDQRLDALGTEIARGVRTTRAVDPHTGAPDTQQEVTP
jgi:DNA-binding transcriptional ArsR family regulator